jgi:peptidylprolyl isomerase
MASNFFERKEANMVRAKYGDTVKVHYTGILEDGSLFGTTIGNAPMQFTIGEDRVIPGFEDAIINMHLGEQKVTTIPMERGFGPRREENILAVKRENFPRYLEVEAGQQLKVPLEGNHSAVITVIDVSESAVILDTNHPLSGKDLIFDIELVDIT